MTGLLRNAGFDMVEEKAELSVWMLCAAFWATFSEHVRDADNRDSRSNT
jgi:hypothetical protein